MVLDQWGIPRFYEDKISFEFDHKLPEMFGGKTVLDNIVLSCRKCNRSRSRLTEQEINELEELKAKFN
jgi:5-methylcytosine-specific restriction endonuclease McrA